MSNWKVNWQNLNERKIAALLNYGYQGMVSIIDALCSRHDVIVYDAESHACIIDGLASSPRSPLCFQAQ